MSKTKLELTWIGKEDRPRLEPRVLIHDLTKSYHAKTKRVGDLFDNRLIFGDNLLALKALEQEFEQKIKCIFIDPPYNTGSAFSHYDDGIEHSLWLSLLRERLEILKRLLSKDGSIWITIDDNEAHYLKILCDEIFGRTNFVANCIWQKVYSERMDATGFSVSHDHVLVYRKSDAFNVNPVSQEQNKSQFGYFDQKIQKYYRRRSLRKEGSESLRADRPSMWYKISAPDGTDVWPRKPDGTEGRWRWKQENVDLNKDELEFVLKDGVWEIYVKQYLDENATRPPATIWLSEDVGHNHEAKLEVKAFNPLDVFDTPKPERLLKHVILLATAPGDIVLDSFAGSGTTGAVAQKIGRRWIMIEMGEHCQTHIIPRLKKVIDGTDQGGISQAVGWKGGGGFRYYRLAHTLIKKDAWGNEVINPEFNPEWIAEAVCKLEGFIYAPSESEFWRHGQSTENDFIYLTTQTLTTEQLNRLSDEVGPKRSLLVCCGAWRAKDLTPWSNLTLKKIPKAVLDKAEWDHDDYSLAISQLPVEEEEVKELDSKPENKKHLKNLSGQEDLFTSPRKTVEKHLKKK